MGWQRSAIMGQQDRQKGGARRQEVLTLLLLFVILFFLLALASYLAPLLGPEPARQVPEGNWCGAIGFYSAHYLFSFLGLIG
ncbi:MAG: DNA translocase FtsK 4TM domain-containing protein, partial [Proteobacteria bacterium]|nr:DNA translocase FtsK 4TM domain-containing protein [Pseudomonadota bacterium]